MDYKSILKKILIPNKKGIDHKKLNRILNRQLKYQNIFNYLLNIYKDSNNIEETLKRLILNINKKPLCPICHKPVNFIGKKSKMFSKYCSNSCRAKDPKNYNKWVEGQKKYNIENYGVEYNWQRSDCKDKRKQSLINHYGTVKLYQVPEIKEKIYETLKDKINEIYKKRDITLSKKYKVSSFGELISLPEIQNKINNTKKKNGTFKSSNPEDKSYELLKEKYPDIIRQYRSNVYPFNCDFYIPSLDLYIECQYGQFHHHRPYIGNEQDLKDVEILKEKANHIHKQNNVKKSRYDVELETWTIRDVKKRKIAKENKLNYIEFWNIDELKIWLNK